MVKKLTPDSPVKTKKVTHECGCSFSLTEDLEDEEGNEKPGKLTATLCGEHKHILGSSSIEQLVQAALDAA